MGKGLSIKEAAEALGLSANAVRKRVERGTLPAQKEGGKWVVFLPGGDQGGGEPGDQAATRQLLEEEVKFLRQELEARRQEAQEWAEAARRKDHIIAVLVQQTKALPARELDQEEESRREPRRPWWKRLFFFRESENSENQPK